MTRQTVPATHTVFVLLSGSLIHLALPTIYPRLVLYVTDANLLPRLSVYAFRPRYPSTCDLFVTVFTALAFLDLSSPTASPPMVTLRHHYGTEYGMRYGYRTIQRILRHECAT